MRGDADLIFNKCVARDFAPAARSRPSGAGVEQGGHYAGAARIGIDHQPSK